MAGDNHTLRHASAVLRLRPQSRVKAMLAQLEDGPKAGDGATAEQLAFRRQALDAVIF